MQSPFIKIVSVEQFAHPVESFFQRAMAVDQTSLYVRMKFDEIYTVAQNATAGMTAQRRRRSW